MDYLIDRKFWNLVINKADPITAMAIRQALKLEKLAWVSKIELEKELILKLPNKKIKYGFCRKLIKEGALIFSKCDLSLSIKDEEPWEKFLELEKTILGVLIETQGLSPNVKYDVFGKIIDIVKQD
tara:strand:- start:56 stop:433 length:378 start_codon:yes stop_codon:yes gene_type:complete